MIPFTYYKGPHVPKGQQPCLLCPVHRLPAQRVSLGYGEEVWLCQQHSSREFRRSREGRDFRLTMMYKLGSACAWTTRRRLAVDRFLATDAYEDAACAERPRPGSYAWPEVRQAVEELCRRGRCSIDELWRCVVAALKGATRWGWVRMPSLRTVRRWRAERRWEAPGWVGPERLPKGV